MNLEDGRTWVLAFYPVMIDLSTIYINNNLYIFLNLISDFVYILEKIVFSIYFWIINKKMPRKRFTTSHFKDRSHSRMLDKEMIDIKKVEKEFYKDAMYFYLMHNGYSFNKAELIVKWIFSDRDKII